MPVRRINGKWVYRKRLQLPDGRRTRIAGSPAINTRAAAEAAERAHVERALSQKKEVPTFDEWFNGRYWREWVIGRKNKPSSVEAKRSVYALYLKSEFGHLRLDEINVGRVAAFRAKLVERTKRPLSEKSINNVLAILSKPLRYAFDVELINRAPKVGLFRVEQPEIEFWDFQQYARLLAAAKKDGKTVYAAACLAGEAGLRVGEVKALRWREDVDLIARTITVNQQIRRGVVGTPKGRTRRTVPMTETLHLALKSLDVVRTGLVIRDLAGHAMNSENQLKNLMYRICRLAGLPERGWHTLRHTFGTHPAMFGVNPWRLMAWLGHKRIDETHRYVHVADAHLRDTPPEVMAAAASETNPDRRILQMLGARNLVRWEGEKAGSAGQEAGSAGHVVGTKENASEVSAGVLTA